MKTSLRPKLLLVTTLCAAALVFAACPVPTSAQSGGPPSLPAGSPPQLVYVTNTVYQPVFITATNNPPDPGAALAGSPLTTALNQIQNIDTNATIFEKDTMELRLGAVSQGITGTAFDSSLALDYYFHPNFGAGLEIVNGNIGGGVQSVNATMILRKPLGNFCVAGFMGGGRNLEDSAFQGIAGIRVSYSMKPTSRMFTYVESALVVNKATVNKPTTRFALGLGYAF